MNMPRGPINRSDWLEPDRLLASSYPFEPDALAGLAAQGITLVVNLHERGHAPERLGSAGLTELHLPVPDFTPPTAEQLERGVRAIRQALDDGERVAVHCAAGLGRTGTLLACYLVSTGLDPAAAITRIRQVRPGSVETPNQQAAVEAFARRWLARPADEPGSSQETPDDLPGDKHR